MSVRAPFLSLVLLSAACGPPRAAPDPPPRVWNVSARALFNAYVDGNDPKWDGQTVRVTLPVDGYALAPRSILWHDRRPNGAAAIVFEVAAPPKDNTGPLVLVGTVRGRVADQEHRDSGHRWHVLVAGCAVER